MKHAKSGFTLIELMVVLAVVAVLATVAAPSFVSYLKTQRLKGAAGELVTDLQFARMESVQKNSAITVTFSAGGYTIAQGGTTLKTVALTGGATVTGGNTVVISYEPVRAMATIVNGPDVTLTDSSTGRQLRVTVNTMGRVVLCSPSGTVKGYDTCA